jgi:hypothetical protein
MLESKFQANLIKEIKTTFPGCVVLKNDSSYLQGIPDLSIFYKDKWAMLEVKKDEKANNYKTPNVSQMMSSAQASIPKISVPKF